MAENRSAGPYLRQPRRKSNVAASLLCNICSNGVVCMTGKLYSLSYGFIALSSYNDGGPMTLMISTS